MTIEYEDMAMPSATTDTEKYSIRVTTSENETSLPENSPITEEQESEEQLNKTGNNNNKNNNITEYTSTSTQAQAHVHAQVPKKPIGNSISFDEDSITNSKSKHNNSEGETMGVGRLSPPSSSSDGATDCMNADDVDVDITYQSQRIEPEGTTTVFDKKASRRFDEDMLDKVLSGESVEEGQDTEGTTMMMERIESDDFKAQEINDVGEDTTEKKPREPPGSPATIERTTSETAAEREGRIIDAANHQAESLLDETRVEVLEEGGGITKQPSPEINNIKNNNNSNNRNPNIGTTNAHASNQPTTYHENIRQNSSNSLSPDYYLGDHETIPIPHLPPLVVPGIGTRTSYDSAGSMSGAGQGHLNNNGFQQVHQRSSLVQQQQQQQSVLPIPNQVTTMSGGKRRIHLLLREDVSSLMEPEKSGFLSFRRKKGILRKQPMQSSSISGFGGGANNSNNNFRNNNNNHWADRGSLTVSWYEGTSSLELQEHVQNSVIRKLGLKGTTKLLDFRVLDESSNPPEEIVLSPYIPDGSRLLLQFATTDVEGDITPPKYTRFSDYNDGPPSPSAAPSPYPTSLDLNGLGLNANQLALLGTRLNSLTRLNGLQPPLSEGAGANNSEKLQQQNGRKSQSSKQQPPEKKSPKDDEDDSNSKGSNMEVASLHPEDQIQKSLREITGLLLKERKSGGSVPRQEKRQVVFVLANYFVLFLSLLAISAEIQARAPNWHAAMEQHWKNVHDCSMDKEALFQCVENGDMAGLVASVVLWVSRSAATKRIFLLGFGSSYKLWTAVYESLVTAFVWGFSYIFIRRGMNPDNNRDFIRRFWKDAVYGSLAGFNAAFMKQVLKNLIPQEVIEDALQERQLKILSWLPSIGMG